MPKFTPPGLHSCHTKQVPQPSMHSRLDGLPHQESVIPVEVVGNVLCTVHAPGLDGLRKAQGGVGEVLHGPLHHLHMATTPCGIGLEWEGRENAMS